MTSIKVQCEKCGHSSYSSEMTRYYDILEDKIVYECKKESECFDMLKVIDDFVDSE